jgi:protein farnesyltransferase/geranylgeranyltransferase type-1 subunit alpha
MNSFAEENLKSYQVWHHRLTLLLHLSPTLSTGLQEEIDFVHASLLRDTKNYHTWSYLHWIFSHFSALDAEKGGDRFAEEDWEKELAWCEGMLDSDLKIGEVEEEEVKGDGRNNSAWGWRWYLTMARGGVQGKKDVEKEIR